MAGLIGGAIIAAWFFVFDAARGEALKTPVLLAAALLHMTPQSTAMSTRGTVTLPFSSTAASMTAAT